MTEQPEAPLWARRVAARVARPRTPDQADTGREVPAWARVVAEQAAGRTPDPEVVREARAGARRQRKQWETDLLARLGYDDDSDGPTAA